MKLSQHIPTLRGAAYMLLACSLWFGWAEWTGKIQPPWYLANPFDETLTKGK